MELQTIFLLTYMGLVISALLKLFFSYKIYHHTKGATVGWKHLAFYGFVSAASFIYGFFVTLLMYDSDTSTDPFHATLSIIGVIIAYFMCYYIISAFDSFMKDFGFKIKCCTKKSMLILHGIVMLIIILTNLDVLISDLGLFAISFQNLFIATALLIVSVPAYKLVMMTKRSPWIIMLIGFILAGVLVVGYEWSAGCCANGSGFEQSVGCDSKRSYTSIFPQYCTETFVRMNVVFSFLIMVNSYLILVPFIQFWRILRHSTGK